MNRNSSFYLRNEKRKEKKNKEREKRWFPWLLLRTDSFYWISFAVLSLSLSLKLELFNVITVCSLCYVSATSFLYCLLCVVFCYPPPPPTTEHNYSCIEEHHEPDLYSGVRVKV